MNRLLVSEALAFLGFEEDSNFIITETPVSEGETEVGKMNEFEISCMSSLEKINSRLKDIIKNKNKKSDFSKEEMLEIESKQKNIKLLSKLMWGSIKSRFPNREEDSLGVRDGNTIVAFNEEEDPLANLLSNIGGIGIFHIGPFGHRD